MSLNYAVIFERAANNLAAYIPDLPHCIPTGVTLEEADRNIRERSRIWGIGPGSNNAGQASRNHNRRKPCQATLISSARLGSLYHRYSWRNARQGRGPVNPKQTIDVGNSECERQLATDLSDLLISAPARQRGRKSGELR
jgi:hypothetical protein